ncbi:MAG: class I SAM-dependent methyltransferase [Pseudomonadota bacterium]
MSGPDWGHTASDYAKHRQGFPKRLFDWLATITPLQCDVLDLGTGTGLLARELARQGGSVTSIDPSAEMLEQAEAAARREGLDIIHKEATAENTGLTGPTFDLITAGTCWHWFDRPKAVQECLRLLRPGGHLLIAHLDWLTRPHNVIDITRQAIQKWSPPPTGRAMTFQYPEWLYELTENGFGDYVVTGFPAMLTYSHDAWAGRIVASAHIAPVLSPDDVEAFRAEFKATLTQRFPGEQMQVEHRIFAVCLTRP